MTRRSQRGLNRRSRAPREDGRGEEAASQPPRHPTDLDPDNAASSDLNAGENVLPRVFHDLPVGLIVIDRAQMIVRVNRAFAEILGLQRDQLLGRRASDVAAEASAPPDEVFLNYLCQSEASSQSIERRFGRMDGDAFIGRATVHLVPDRSGSPAYRLGILEDVTERHRAEQARRNESEVETARELDHARLDGVLLAARLTADRLGNALSLTRGYNELVLEQYELQPAVRQMLQESTHGLQLAVEFLHDLQQINQVNIRDTPVGPMLDMPRSTPRPSPDAGTLGHGDARI